VLGVFFVFVFFSFVSVICFVYPTLLEFLEYPFFIAPSVFYNVNLQRQYIYQTNDKDKSEHIGFHSKRSNIITKMKDNTNVISTIVTSINCS